MHLSIINTDLVFPPKNRAKLEPSKMVTRTMASELLSLVSPFNYCMLIPCLSADDFIPIRMFQRSQLGKIFNIDRSNCLHNGEVNNLHLFELFGAYSDEDTESVRSDTLECINTGREVYELVGQIFFAWREWNLMDWALTACSSYYYGDELLLFVLCRLFHRHALVICREINWSTLEPEGPMNTEQLLDACDLHLIYLRPGIFRELRLKKGKSRDMLDSSPPEFPTWTTDMVQGNILDMPRLEGFVDSPLLKTYLNINDDESALNDSDDVNAVVNTMTREQIEPAIVTTTTNDDNTHDGDGENGKGVLKGRNTENSDGEILSLNGGNSIITLKGRNDLPPGINENSTSTVAYEDNDEDWDQTMDIHYTASDFEVTSPLSIKASCTQALLNNLCSKKPMSLMHCCVDVITWNTDIAFLCDMILPHSLFTFKVQGELRRLDPKLLPHHKAIQVTLYDKFTIDKEARDLWLKDVKKKKYVVSLPKLTDEEIDVLCNKEPSWKALDPYSDLEDVGTTSHDEEPVTDTQSQPYSLRKRNVTEPKSSRPARAARSDVKYSNFFDDLELPDSPKVTAKKPRPTVQGPSEERIAARGKRSIPPLQTHPVAVIESRKAETSSSENLSSNSDGGDTDSDTTIILDQQDEQNTSELLVTNEEVTMKKKRVFITRRVGLKKFRRKRS